MRSEKFSDLCPAASNQPAFNNTGEYLVNIMSNVNQTGSCSVVTDAGGNSFHNDKD